MTARGAITRAVRAWFEEQGFAEVETGILQVSPGNETHLHAPRTELTGADGARAARYLRTSPEFACKKLLAAGEQKIFEFARVFRDRERGDLHLPEFTMLEWYRANATYDAVMADSVVVIAHAAQATGIGRFSFRGRTADPFAEPELLTVAAAFERFAGIDLLGDHCGRRGRSRGAGGGGKDAGADHGGRHLVGHLQQGAGRACRATSGAGASDGAVRISGARGGAGARQSSPIRASPSASRSMPAASNSPTASAN